MKRKKKWSLRTDLITIIECAKRHDFTKQDKYIEEYNKKQSPFWDEIPWLEARKE